MRRSLGYGVVSNHRGNRNGGGGFRKFGEKCRLRPPAVMVYASTEMKLSKMS